MRNAQKQAIMAMFAAMRQNEEGEEASQTSTEHGRETTSRLIEVDLQALARGRMALSGLKV